MIRVSDTWFITWNPLDLATLDFSGAGHRHSKLGSADSTGVGSGGIAAYSTEYCFG